MRGFQEKITEMVREKFALFQADITDVYFCGALTDEQPNRNEWLFRIIVQDGRSCTKFGVSEPIGKRLFLESHLNESRVLEEIIDRMFVKLKHLITDNRQDLSPRFTLESNPRSERCCNALHVSDTNSIAPSGANLEVRDPTTVEGGCNFGADLAIQDDPSRIPVLTHCIECSKEFEAGEWASVVEWERGILGETNRPKYLVCMKCMEEFKGLKVQEFKG